jgi:hypothetical protein
MATFAICASHTSFVARKNVGKITYKPAHCQWRSTGFWVAGIFDDVREGPQVCGYVGHALLEYATARFIEKRAVI